MQKGSFKCRSFHFTGDGRNQLNDGTAAGSNGITVNNMAISILCNAAACFIESGEWVEDSSMLSGASTMTIRTNTISFLTYSYTADYAQSTTPYVYYTYLKRAGISDYASAAKIMLMYQATKGIRGINEVTGGVSGSGTSNRYYQIVDHYGENFENSPTSANDLSLIYLPPGGGSWSNVLTGGGIDAKNFKVMALDNRSSWSTSYPNSCHNISNKVCSYHILTSEDTIGIFYTNTNQQTAIKGFVVGDLLDTATLGPRDNFFLRSYAAFSTQGQNPGSGTSNYGLCGNDSCFLSYNTIDLRRVFSNNSSDFVPITQFFIPDGSLCSASSINGYNSNYGQLIMWLIDDSVCRANNWKRTVTTQLNVTPIGVGIVPSSYWRYRCGLVDPITGSCYKGKFDINALFFSGTQGSSSYYCEPLFSPGNLFDNGNYIHLGSGIWMGWHPDNGSIFTNTGDEMVIYTPPGA